MSDEKFWCVVNDTRNNTSWTRTTTTCQTKQTTRRVGGGAGDTKNDDQEDLGEEVDRREVLPHTRRQKLDEENYEKFQCDIDDTRDDSSRYVVCGTTKKISVKKWVDRLTDEKFSRAWWTPRGTIQIGREVPVRGERHQRRLVARVGVCWTTKKDDQEGHVEEVGEG